MINDFLTILFSPFGGVSVVLVGLASIIGKIWVDRTIEKYKRDYSEQLKRVQSELDKTSRLLEAELQKGIHIHKIQFEKEFNLYGLIWEQLVQVRKNALSLRPILDTVDPGEPEEERMRRRLRELAESFNPFIDLVEKHRPFYPQEVYESLVRLIKQIHSEAIDYEYKERPRSEYWREARTNQETIVKLIDDICESIRRRIAGINVSNN
jgi:hypothetical protein